MLEKATIARPYAEAAFAQAVDESQLNEWSAFLGSLKTIVEDAGMQTVIGNPKMSQEQLAGFIIDICGSSISQSCKNFVKILVNAERINLATEVFNLFEQKRAAAQGISDVKVTSAFPLDDSQTSGIADAISRRLGKQVNVETSEDKDLIGGVVIRAGDAVIDASVRGRLKELNNLFAQ